MSVGCRSRGPGTGLPLWAPVILVVLATSQRWAEASLARGLERQNAVAPIKQLPARSLLQQDEGKWKAEPRSPFRPANQSSLSAAPDSRAALPLHSGLPTAAGTAGLRRLVVWGRAVEVGDAASLPAVAVHTKASEHTGARSVPRLGVRLLSVHRQASRALMHVQASVPPDLAAADARVRQIGVAAFSAVALRSNGSLAVFGNTRLLGPESAWRSLNNVQRLAVGYQHVLVQLQDGTLSGFGDAAHASSFTIPAAVNAALLSGRQRLWDFAAGRNISVVLLGPSGTSAAARPSTYSLWTFGNVEQDAPTHVQEAVAAVGASKVAACGPPARGGPAFLVLLRNGTVLAWGDNRWVRSAACTSALPRSSRCAS